MDHFDKIFHQKPLQVVTQEIDLILTRLRRLCKIRPWIKKKTGDRVLWASLEDKFVEKFDVPWSSGNQMQLENLMPNQTHSTNPRRTKQPRRKTQKRLRAGDM